jgi:hypothetical protein
VRAAPALANIAGHVNERSPPMKTSSCLGLAVVATAAQAQDLAGRMAG